MKVGDITARQLGKRFVVHGVSGTLIRFGTCECQFRLDKPKTQVIGDSILDSYFLWADWDDPCVVLDD